MINFFFENITRFEIAAQTVDWLQSLPTCEGKKCGKINYIFCDDDYLLKINRDHLQHDYYTDIITFDYVKGNTISGDIFVSLPRIVENSTQFDNFTLEFHRVLAHGILHLCGYKDKSDNEIQLMRSKEDFYLTKLYKQSFT